MKSFIKNKRVAISSFRRKQFNGKMMNEMILIRKILCLYIFVNYMITIIETTTVSFILIIVMLKDYNANFARVV